MDSRVSCFHNCMLYERGSGDGFALNYAEFSILHIDKGPTCMSMQRALRWEAASSLPLSWHFWAASRKRPAAVALHRLICSSDTSTSHLTLPRASSVDSSLLVCSRISCAEQILPHLAPAWHP